MVNREQNDFHYLKRYQEGHYREVWNELVEMGPAVFEEQVYPEALAVTREMMRRVRVNIETLILRLLQRGFVFGYDFCLKGQLARSLTSAQERPKYREMKDWVHEQPLVFWPVKQREEEMAEVQQWLEEGQSLSPFFDEGDDENYSKQTKIYVDELEQVLGHVPLAVRAWFEEIEEVNFYGYHPQWNELVLSFDEYAVLKPGSYRLGTFLMSDCDPFQISSLDEQKITSLKEEYRRDKSCQLEFAPDRYFKDFCGGSSTPYGFMLPQASADAMMPTSSGWTTFVEYIRVSLAWGGFPGMSEWPKVPRDDLDFLTRDLLPF